jgi:hypothetical protein
VLETLKRFTFVTMRTMRTPEGALVWGCFTEGALVCVPDATKVPVACDAGTEGIPEAADPPKTKTAPTASGPKNRETDFGLA